MEPSFDLKSILIKFVFVLPWLLYLNVYLSSEYTVALPEFATTGFIGAIIGFMAIAVFIFVLLLGFIPGLVMILIVDALLLPLGVVSAVFSLIVLGMVSLFAKRNYSLENKTIIVNLIFYGFYALSTLSLVTVYYEPKGGYGVFTTMTLYGFVASLPVLGACVSLLYNIRSMDNRS